MKLEEEVDPCNDEVKQYHPKVKIIKNALKKISPSAFDAFRKLWYSYTLKKAHSSFNSASNNSAFLLFNELELLDSAYSVQPGLLYDAESLKLRAFERYSELSNLLAKHHHSKPESVLEIGCGDGMICYFFANNGSNCFAIDNDASLFDQRAVSKGVKFKKMDAANLEFKENTFDFIFNYNIYEHLNDPGKTFLNSLRVLKPGGIMYIKFSPTYHSPFGFHVYNSIAVPYCHILFSANTLNEFVIRKKRKPINYSFRSLNEFTVQEFRKIWKLNDSEISFLEYREIKNLAFANIINKYASHFKSTKVDFENFITEGFEFIIKKK